MPRRNYSRSRKYNYASINHTDNKSITHENEEVEDVESKSSQPAFNFLDTGVVIAILTALGYLTAYAYQKGYWEYYGVTQEFLRQISVVNVLISITVVGFSMIMLFFTYKNLTFAVPDSNNPLRRILKQIFFPFFFLAIVISILIPKNMFYIQPQHILYLALIILVLSYATPIFTQWDVKGYRNKIIKHLEKYEEEGMTPENIIFALKYFPTAKYFFLIVACITIFYISLAWGYKTAADKEEYLLLKFKQQNYLVIDNNGDNFIVAPVDLKKKEIKKQFQLIEAKSELSKPLLFENVWFKDGVKVSEQKKY
ncbi:hypothetical protein [Priestia aryabhattai]|uniref:hypothetical protein n=1 Tax=Priestia aryabhattai TaxID=412384 RepID=UPI0015F4C1E9|nr:hypothetical protein [Priestia aryabhattai]